MSRAAAEGGLEELLADGPVSTEPDTRGVAAQLAKTAGAEGSWQNGMLLSWQRRASPLWSLFVWRDHPGGSITRFWPGDAEARRRWKKENPPSPLLRLARSLILPADPGHTDNLHSLLLLQAALHAVQEGLVELSADPAAGALYQRFQSMAKRLYDPQDLDPWELQDTIRAVYENLFLHGPRRGFLGAHFARSFPQYVVTKLRAVGGQVLREKRFRARMEGSRDPADVGVPPGLREAGRRLGVSKSSVERHLKTLGYHGLTEESWHAVVDRITAKAAWRELQDRLMLEGGLLYEAARKRIQRHKKANRKVEEARQLEFPDESTSALEEVPTGDDWEPLVTYFQDIGCSRSDARHAVLKLRSDGFDTPQAAAARAVELAMAGDLTPWLQDTGVEASG